MGTYLIRAVKIEDGEVASALVSGIGNVEGQEGIFAVDEGRIDDRAQLATLTLVEDVYVATIPENGRYGIGSRVTRKAGQMEYLVSVNDDGTPNDDLINLPKLN